MGCPPRSVLLLLLLFFLPGVVMAVSYGLISRELCRGGRLQMGEAEPPPQAPRPPPEGDVRYLQLPGAELELQNRGGEVSQAAPQPPPHRVIASQAQLLAKRRVIRMLVAIVAIFFLCWLPLFVANTWRAFSPRAAGRALSGTPMAFIHLLSYSSACANPLLYGLMNRRFRDAILGSCHPPRTGRHRTPPRPPLLLLPKTPRGAAGGWAEAAGRGRGGDHRHPLHLQGQLHHRQQPGTTLRPPGSPRDHPETTLRPLGSP
ncbi:LOW QUALITY PROTEIN: gastrin/cholecystokinin type B receptor [Heliangelus exortis]|uniref:LOW QUALITY PROTEIN: gastrin/cholecystokinin type B receptor n=1 Tax=Heliangelus exortis TaxID=472823 RepID=UPI003A933EB1